MKNAITAITLNSLQVVAEQFEQWRQEKKVKKGRIPEHLWKAAVELTKKYPAEKVAEALNIIMLY